MEFQRELEALYQKALELKTQGLWADAETLELKAARILQDLKDHAARKPEDEESASILLYLAEREWAMDGDTPSVRAKIDQAIRLRQTHYGAEHALTAEAVAKLAEIHFLAGRFAEAEPLYRQALISFEKPGAAQGPTYTAVLEGLAQTLASLGRPAEADPYFSAAIERPGDGAQRKRSLYFLLIFRADGLEKLGRHAEAVVLRQRAVALLPGNNPGEQGFHV